MERGSLLSKSWMLESHAVIGVLLLEAQLLIEALGLLVLHLYADVDLLAPHGARDALCLLHQERSHSFVLGTLGDDELGDRGVVAAVVKRGKDEKDQQTRLGRSILREQEAPLRRGDHLPPVSYTHLRAHETRHDLVCRLLLEKKKK